MEMYDRKYMFGDKFTFGSSQNGQNMPKKGQQEIISFCALNKGQLHKVLHFIFPLKICTFLRELGEERYTFLPFVHFSI